MLNVRPANKVISLGKNKKTLDIIFQSVIAQPEKIAEFVNYIEVKSTKELTSQELNGHLWIDTLNVTSNKWIAAHKYKAYYSILECFLQGMEYLLLL